MMVSEKFNTFYESLNYEDKIKTMEIVNMLCKEHEEMMNRKQEKLITIGTIANKLLFQALTSGNTKQISEQMSRLKEEAEATSKFMPIERYIEIHFGL